MRRHPHLYEISAWPWLERIGAESGRRVTLADVPDAQWDAIARYGIDIVYLMGVWKRSAIGLQDFGRVRVERARDRRAAAHPGVGHRGVEDRLVPSVDAVEDSEGDHAGSSVRREFGACCFPARVPPMAITRSRR